MREVRWGTIHRTLVDRFGFTGSHFSVRRSAQRLKMHGPDAPSISDFVLGETAQVDFGEGPTQADVLAGGVILTWIFVIILRFSRNMAQRSSPTRRL